MAKFPDEDQLFPADAFDLAALGFMDLGEEGEVDTAPEADDRSEEHTSELQSPWN